MWPIAWRIMMRRYEVGPEAAAESRAKLEEELDWLDTKLADGRAFLVSATLAQYQLALVSAASERVRQVLDHVRAAATGGFVFTGATGDQRWPNFGRLASSIPSFRLMGSATLAVSFVDSARTSSA
jgi:glutathione S-transferase